MKEENSSTLNFQDFNKTVDVFNYLYCCYNHTVRYKIYKYINQKDIVEDILQEVFLSLWQNYLELENELPIEEWLLEESKKKSLCYLKEMHIENINKHTTNLNIEITDDYINTDNLIEIKLQLVKNAIRQLPKRKKEILYLCKIQGKSFEETALALGITEFTVKEHLKVSLKFIKKQVLSIYYRYK